MTRPYYGAILGVAGFAWISPGTGSPKALFKPYFSRACPQDDVSSTRQTPSNEAWLAGWLTHPIAWLNPSPGGCQRSHVGLKRGAVLKLYHHTTVGFWPSFIALAAQP